MKGYIKYVVGVVVLGALGLYIVFSNRSAQTATSMPTPNPTTTGTGSESASTTSSSGGSGSTPGTSGTYADGSYTGSVENAIYGSVQVSAIISGGRLISVNILQKPDAPGHTTDVSQESLPILVTEAIQAQSANVQIVSGATQTSQAFQQSLSVALTAAAQSSS
jgi:uncharacterized protein with FMN-binding domain